MNGHVIPLISDKPISGFQRALHLVKALTPLNAQEGLCAIDAWHRQGKLTQKERDALLEFYGVGQ